MTGWLHDLAEEARRLGHVLKGISLVIISVAGALALLAKAFALWGDGAYVSRSEFDLREKAIRQYIQDEDAKLSTIQDAERAIILQRLEAFEKVLDKQDVKLDKVLWSLQEQRQVSRHE